jgi:quinohemoprotein ethanol dehydrogenase
MHESPWNAGVLTTDDLVFQGTAEGKLVAYDARMGERLWESSLNTGIVAPPITYMIDDMQYISIAVGWGGVFGQWFKNTKQINPGTIYTFALGKSQPMPDYPIKPDDQLVSLPVTASEVEIENGAALFGQYCDGCHKLDAGGSIPNLTLSTPETFKAFNEIVSGGAYLPKGMPKFDDRLSEQDVADIEQFILSTAERKSNGAN